MRRTLCTPSTLVALAGLAGCSAGGGAPIVDVDPRRQERPEIEEPDLYRRDGAILYVQNRETGLNVIDTADPARPRLVGRLAETGGAGAELLVLTGDRVAILLDAATPACRPLDATARERPEAELLLVDARDRALPRLVDRRCLPGGLVAARAIDGVLYVVTTNPLGSRALALDLADLARPALAGERVFMGASKEILLTPSLLVVAARLAEGTRLQLLSIGAAGELAVRGSISVPGEPQGRFHLDLRGALLRIVTFEGSSSRLSVIDVSNLDQPSLVGELPGIGRSERLYATRFDGDLAYVVTFRRTDPLWVISLADPARPELLGELQVPGWSDYLFPRGDRLVAVGRGPGGRGVGVSLFDVSTPSEPRALRQLDLGAADARSEANLDHRGITIVDELGGAPLLVVPFSSVTWSTDASARRLCTVEERLQLIDLLPGDLRARGAASERGAIRRSFPVAGRLYGLSDFELAALDVADRDRPRADTTVTLGTAEGLARSVRATCDATRRTTWDD